MRSLITLLAVISSTSALGAHNSISRSIFTRVTQEYSVDPLLVEAVCITESGLDPVAYNWNDGGYHNSSYGACQLLLNTAKLRGWNIHGCARDYRNPMKRLSKNCPLFDPEVNVRHASEEISRQLRRYHGIISEALSAYNGGSARYLVGKPKILRNQNYVSKVLEIYNRLRRSK